MRANYIEKRSFTRIDTDCSIGFCELNTIREGGQFHGRCQNLSAGGILFNTDQDLSAGKLLRLEITPQQALLAPFRAIVKVVRSRKLGNAEHYQVAGTFEEILR